MPDKKYTYRVLPGRRFGPYNQYGPGDTIELTTDEAEGFRDILELVKGENAPPEEAPDHAAHLETLTVAQLKALPEWGEVEPPRPSTKPEIVAAILAIRVPHQQEAREAG